MIRTHAQTVHMFYNLNDIKAHVYFRERKCIYLHKCIHIWLQRVLMYVSMLHIKYSVVLALTTRCSTAHVSHLSCDWLLIGCIYPQFEDIAAHTTFTFYLIRHKIKENKRKYIGIIFKIRCRQVTWRKAMEDAVPPDGSLPSTETMHYVYISLLQWKLQIIKKKKKTIMYEISAKWKWRKTMGSNNATSKNRVAIGGKTFCFALKFELYSYIIHLLMFRKMFKISSNR